MIPEEIGELAGLGTATVSDALDRLRLPGSAHGLAPIADGLRTAGRAFTVRYAPAGAVPGTVGDYIDDMEPGWVAALDNDGRTDCTVWGDILTAVAHHRGIAGTVIDGVCRDTREALGRGYPVFSRGRFMRTGKDRVEVVEVGGTITLADVQVRHGDLILGDEDGVVVVPWDEADRVAATAREIAAREDEILNLALETGSLRDARTRHGYHLLQRSGR
ncbi:RraA family protein [Spongiactinospora sp. TRM90649]|uniref:RraA family protein n=1 Tax=Spongiactinospora sp. TRM90649 TaxID=3031114 RepID=UPI0023F95479|nr:RraA family protein [Spongiactinospora sp. TRM90649]MDF5756927.1 RraA family protein [Spongiactinospora sp. TRM90649]